MTWNRLWGKIKKKDRRELTYEELIEKYPELDMHMSIPTNMVTKGVEEQIRYIKDAEYRNKMIEKRINIIFHDSK